MLTRKVTDFVKLEEGNISKKSALTVGSVLAIAAGSAGVAHAGWFTYEPPPYTYAGDAKADCETYCKGTLTCAVWHPCPQQEVFSHCC